MYSYIVDTNLLVTVLTDKIFQNPSDIQTQSLMKTECLTRMPSHMQEISEPCRPRTCQRTRRYFREQQFNKRIWTSSQSISWSFCVQLRSPFPSYLPFWSILVTLSIELHTKRTTTIKPTYHPGLLFRNYQWLTGNALCLTRFPPLLE